MEWLTLAIAVIVSVGAGLAAGRFVLWALFMLMAQPAARSSVLLADRRPG